jgi:hypothetical protein
MKLEELKKYGAYKIDKINNGTVVHHCCLCTVDITERKIKVLAKKDDIYKQFFFCVQCFPNAIKNFCNSPIGPEDRKRMKY